MALALVAHNFGAATGGGGGAAAGGGGRRILQVLSYRHGLRSVPGGEECGRGRQLDGSSAGPAGVRQRDAVDPLPVGGVRGQRVGVLQRGDWSRIHVLLSVVHSAVSNHTVFARDVRVTTFLLTRSTRSLICRQVYEAYRNGKVEEAMSFGFLFFLFSGDLTSFAGCYLTSQLPIQVNRNPPAPPRCVLVSAPSTPSISVWSVPSCSQIYYISVDIYIYMLFLSFFLFLSS